MILRNCKYFTRRGFVTFLFLTKNSIEHTFKEDRSSLHLCPVLMFLTLAFIDEVFEDFPTLEKLFNYRFALGRKKYLRVNYKASKSQLFPLGGRDSKLGPISPTLPWKNDHVCKAMNALSQRAGYAMWGTGVCMAKRFINHFARLVELFILILKLVADVNLQQSFLQQRSNKLPAMLSLRQFRNILQTI